MNNSTQAKTYKSPRRKLVRFFEKSRDQWKTKHHQAKADVKRLTNRVRFLERSKADLQKQVAELQRALAQHQSQEQALTQALETQQKKRSSHP
jgi:chromosome segregation ATPase